MTFEARSPSAALKKAKRRGKAGEFDHPIPGAKDGHVYFEFVGVQQLIDLGSECEDDEVWYDIREIVRPMERAKQLIPAEADLYAFKIPVRKRPMKPW